MVKDFIGSFSENLMEKSRNPFLGTYALVWLVRNWIIVYTLFNFDKELNMQDRIGIISCYFSNKPFLENLGINILWALGLLALSYFLLNVSRFIMNLSEKHATPWVYKITDKSTIVTKDVYNEALKRINDLEAIVDNERKRRFEAENRADEIEKKLMDKKVSTNEVEFKNTNQIHRQYQELFEMGQLDEFKEQALSLLERPLKLEFTNNDYRGFLFLNELIASHDRNSSFSKLTPKGKELLHYIVSLEDKPSHG